jgi:hypothetical protein
VGYLAVLVPLPASIAYGSSTNSLLPAGYITWDENSMLMDTCQDELNNIHGNEGTVLCLLIKSIIYRCLNLNFDVN